MQLQHAVHNGSVRARADRIDGTLKSLGELSTTTSTVSYTHLTLPTKLEV